MPNPPAAQPTMISNPNTEKRPPKIAVKAALK
jgi:hypothetical protein